MNPPHLKGKPIGKEEAAKLKSIIDALEKDPRSYDFLQPVDHVGWGLTDYLDIVKKPMDLGTLKANLKNEQYSTVDECLEDLKLIWTNCKTYNVEGSEIWKLAHQLEKVSIKNVEKTFKVGKEMKTNKSVGGSTAMKEDESAMNIEEDDKKNK